MSRATNPTLSPPLRPVRSLLRVIGHVPPQVFGAVSRWCPVNADGDHVSVEMLAAAAATAVLPNADMGGPTIGKARSGLARITALTAEKLPVLAVEEDLEFEAMCQALDAARALGAGRRVIASADVDQARGSGTDAALAGLLHPHTEAEEVGLFTVMRRDEQFTDLILTATRRD